MLCYDIVLKNCNETKHVILNFLITVYINTYLNLNFSLDILNLRKM